jgi:hypothetical protein
LVKKRIFLPKKEKERAKKRKKKSDVILGHFTKKKKV